MAIQITNTGVRTLTIFDDEFPYVINKLTCDISIRETDGLIVVSWWNVGKSQSVNKLEFNYSDVTVPTTANISELYDWVLKHLENLGGDLSYESPIKVMGIAGSPITQVPIRANQILKTEDDGAGGFNFIAVDL